MAAMMELFSAELDDFVKDYDDLHWDVSFRGEEYPPRITMDQLVPPLFEMTPDGQKTEDPACIQVIGTPDMRIITTGRLLISKKELTKYVNTAQGLLQLYLHAFMQERKEMEAEQND